MYRSCAILFILGTGCATLPKTGVKATGEPLSFDTGSSVHGYLTTEKVGEVEYRDQGGRNIGSADVYRQKAVTYRKFEWKPKQGNTSLSDEDFFRIAGESRAADEIHSHDQSAWIINRVGLGVVLVGLGLLGGSFATKDTRLGGIGLGLVTVGGITAYVGGNRLAPDEHVLPYDRAKLTADEYNEKLSQTSPR
jgi:hypothetical protein